METIIHYKLNKWLSQRALSIRTFKRDLGITDPIQVSPSVGWFEKTKIHKQTLKGIDFCP